MSFELWISFAIASAALLAIPGPTVMLVVSYALGQGRKTAWSTVPGVALGDFTALTASLLGAGAIFAASATLFTVMKFAGAAYLIWLGYKLWRADVSLGYLKAEKQTHNFWSMFWNSYVVTTLNPKGIVFFVAFVPQFIDVTQPAFAQFAILEATFLTLVIINVIFWAILAGRMRSIFKRPSSMTLANRIGGSFLIGAGLLTAATGRSS